MIKVAFCDDDLSVANEIRVMLDRYRAGQNQKISCDVFHSSLELLSQIEKGVCWDILFLDILMPGENGIDIAKEIRQYDNAVKIIFLTSSPEYAVESYTVGAYFYQIKPMQEESFFRLMDSAVSECEKMQQSSVVLQCKNGIVRIDLGKLVYCEAFGRNLLFYMENGTVLESMGNLDSLSKKLLQYENFMRPHRSFLINMEFVQKISYKAIEMDNLAEIPIPHGKCSEIKNRYLEYVFYKRQVFIS